MIIVLGGGQIYLFGVRGTWSGTSDEPETSHEELPVQPQRVHQRSRTWSGEVKNDNKWVKLISIFIDILFLDIKS